MSDTTPCGPKQLALLAHRYAGGENGALLIREAFSRLDIVEAIDEIIKQLEEDDRHCLPGFKGRSPAAVQINAPLALIQVSISAQHSICVQFREWLQEGAPVVEKPEPEAKA